MKLSAHTLTIALMTLIISLSFVASRDFDKKQNGSGVPVLTFGAATRI